MGGGVRVRGGGVGAKGGLGVEFKDLFKPAVLSYMNQVVMIGMESVVTRLVQANAYTGNSTGAQQKDTRQCAVCDGARRR